MIMNNIDTKAGTAGGTFLIVLLHLSAHHVLETIVYATLGATVSFTVSHILKYIVKKLK